MPKWMAQMKYRRWWIIRGDRSLIRATFYIMIGTPMLINASIEFSNIGSSENQMLDETRVKI